MTEEDRAAQGPASQPEAAMATERVRRAIRALRGALDELESALAAVESWDGNQTSLVQASAPARPESGPAAASDQAWAAWSRPVDTPPAGAWSVPAGAKPSPDSGTGPETAGSDPREQVRRAVESIRAELDAGMSPVEPDQNAAWEAPASQPAPLDEPDSATPEVDPREQVRRAVEQLKAELGGVREDEPRLWAGGQQEAAAEPPPSGPAGLRMPNYEGLIDERLLQPALIVIDDPEGRVELVRVYRTLARLQCAATANLANYSSHSVTVQLEERNVPDADEIRAAVTYAFERECEVEVDGNRASIRLAGGKTRAA